MNPERPQDFCPVPREEWWSHELTEMGRVAGEQVLEGGVGVRFGYVTSEAIITSFHKNVSGCSGLQFRRDVPSGDFAWGASKL